jgi:4'-phosphopantetheinyl transferase
MKWVFQLASGGEGTRSAESGCVRLPADADVVHVVRVNLVHPPENAFDLLDEAERARAARFVFEHDRRRFVAAHAWTRLVLSRSFDCTPESLHFVTGPHGKPDLANRSADVRFNLSHSGERALLAIAVGRPVGVDIEQHRAADLLDVARRFFAPGEIDALERLDGQARLEGFFRCWTRKEALIKAMGDGLSFPLDSFAVHLEEGQSPQVLQTGTVASGTATCWRVVPLETEPGYEAAVAAPAGQWRAVGWDITRT